MFKIRFYLCFSLFTLELFAISPVSRELAEKATNPLSGLTQLQFENDFTPSNFGTKRYSNNFYIKPLGWIEKGILPLPQLIRFKFLIETLPKPQSSKSITGMSDTQVLDLLMLKDISFGDFGFGLIAILPTANKTLLGQGKWQLGPALGLMVRTIPRWQIGFLAQNPISITGRRKLPFQNTLLFQPLITRHFQMGWYLNFDPTWTLTWSSKAIQLPMNFGIGRVFKIGQTKLDLCIETEWMAYKSGPGIIPQFTLQLCLNFIFD